MGFDRFASTKIESGVLATGVMAQQDVTGLKIGEVVQIRVVDLLESRFLQCLSHDSSGEGIIDAQVESGLLQSVIDQ